MAKPSIRITPEQAVQHLADSSRKLADMTANMVYDEPGLFEVLFEVTLTSDAVHAQRASRVMSIVCEKYPEMGQSYVPKIIKALKTLHAEGPIRNLLKILIDVPLKMSEKQTSSLINICFDFLTGNYAVAIKVYSMEILYRISGDLPEIGNELAHILEDQMPDASAGYRSRAKKILQKLPRITS